MTNTYDDAITRGRARYAEGQAILVAREFNAMSGAVECWYGNPAQQVSDEEFRRLVETHRADLGGAFARLGNTGMVYIR